MPLEDPNVIDIVAEADGKVVLIITDSGLTSDPEKRYALLTRKLGGYLQAIVSGEFREQYPHHSTADFVIEVACATPPTPQMEAITRIAPPGDRTNLVEVRYRMFPAEDPATAADAAGAETLLEKAIHVGFREGMSRLINGEEDFCFAVVGAGRETQTVEFARTGDADADYDVAEQYVRDLPLPFTVCVVYHLHPEFKLDDRRQPALLGMAFERGQEKGNLVALTYQPKTPAVEFKAADELRVVGGIPNLFPKT